MPRLAAEVEAAGRKEIGWTMVDSFDPDLIPAGPWLEFHGDRCLPPPQAKILAVNEIGVQAFSIGRHLAVQFHPEVDGPQLSRWLDAGGRAEAERAGQDPDAFLAETVAQEPAARQRADRLVAAGLLLAQGATPRNSPPCWPGRIDRDGPAVFAEPRSAFFHRADDLAEQ